MTQTQQPAALPAAGYTDFRRRRSVGSTLRRAGALARRNKLGAVGVILVLLILFVAIFSPLIKRYDDTESFQTANPDFNPTANPFEIAANPGLASPYILDRWESPLGSDHR